MGRLGEWLRGDRAPVKRDAGTVEAAYLASIREALTEWGYEEEDIRAELPGVYTLTKLGSVAGGDLWVVSDEWGWWYAHLLDSGDSAEVFVAKSLDGTQLLLAPEVAAAFEGRLDELATDVAASLEAWLGERAQPVGKALRIVKADAEQRYTLGIAYPADEVDSHGDFTDAAELERAAWEFTAITRNVGVDHQEGTDGAGTVVESYIYRGPDWLDGDGERLAKAGDWLLGVVWNEATWERIKADDLTGFSIQGVALIDGEAEAPDGE